jgi:rare lipoprotein A
MFKKRESQSQPLHGLILGVIIALATLIFCPPASRAESPPPEDALEKLVLRGSNFEPADGFASYYAKRFEGRRTSSGKRYHPERMTAAHESLPLGTVVRVVNPATKQEVHVTINDRCARKAFHFIDLSRAAAKKIGLWGKGKIKVVIIPLVVEPV